MNMKVENEMALPITKSVTVMLLEPYAGKLARTVLRGESSRKGADLLDFQCFLLHPLLRGRMWQDTDGVLRDETRIGLYSYIHTWNIISCLACLAYMLRLPGLHCLSMSRATHSNVSAYALVRVGLHYRRH